MTAPDIRSANAGVSAPELDGEEDHEEGVGAEVGSVGKVRVEGGGAHLVLHQGEPWCFPAHNGYEAVAQGIAPFGQALGVVVMALVAGVQFGLVGVYGGVGGVGGRIMSRTHGSGRRKGVGESIERACPAPAETKRATGDSVWA
jgi:hypothetical protein